MFYYQNRLQQVSSIILYITFTYNNMKFTTALSATLMFTAKQAVTAQTSYLRGVDKNDVQDGPFAVFKCMIEGRLDESKCSDSKNSDDKPCSYCTLSQNGQKAGICVDPKIAEQMKEQMKGQNADLTCTNIDAENETVLQKEPVVESNLIDALSPMDSLKCTLEGKNDQSMCSTAMTKDGEACNFCSLSVGSQEASLCVDPTVAEQMKKLNKDVKCTGGDSEPENEEQVAVDEPGPGPFDVFKCMFQGRSDKEKCAAATVDDKACSFCSLTKNGETAGICVNEETAEKMKETNADLTCTNTDGVLDQESILESSLFNALLDPPSPYDELKCMFDGRTDQSMCSTATTKDGEACDYCTMSVGTLEASLCVDPIVAEQMKKLNKDVKCTGGDSEPSTDVDGFIKDIGSINSSCVKNGLYGQSADDCKNAVDGQTGEHCVFCSSPNLAGVGLCLPPEFKGKEGRFYSCINTSAVSSE